MTIKNIIFDLGGVIINIDYRRTFAAFRALGVVNIEEFYTQSAQTAMFDDFDIGKINAVEFRALFNSKLQLTLSDEDFDAAWNAMLLDLPRERLDFIQSLRAEGYNVILFSNTNEIHLPVVFDSCRRDLGCDNLDPFFDKLYYSNIFGQRKPNPAAFLSILAENAMLPVETLFIDDSLQHVLGAREAGLHAIHLTKDKSIFGIRNFIESLPAAIEDTPSVALSMP